MRLHGRRAKTINGPFQILAHQLQCVFDALMVAGPTLSAFACGLEVAYLNNLAHLLVALLRIARLSHQQNRPDHLSFLPSERFLASVSRPFSDNHNIWRAIPFMMSSSRGRRPARPTIARRANMMWSGLSSG